MDLRCESQRRSASPAAFAPKRIPPLPPLIRPVSSSPNQRTQTHQPKVHNASQHRQLPELLLLQPQLNPFPLLTPFATSVNPAPILSPSWNAAAAAILLQSKLGRLTFPAQRKPSESSSSNHRLEHCSEDLCHSPQSTPTSTSSSESFESSTSGGPSATFAQISSPKSFVFPSVKARSSFAESSL